MIDFFVIAAAFFAVGFATPVQFECSVNVFTVHCFVFLLYDIRSAAVQVAHAHKYTKYTELLLPFFFFFPCWLKTIEAHSPMSFGPFGPRQRPVPSSSSGDRGDALSPLAYRKPNFTRDIGPLCSFLSALAPPSTHSKVVSLSHNFW